MEDCCNISRVLILRPMLLVAQHTFGQRERCKICLLGPLKMPRNLTIFVQCLITHGKLLSDSQNSLPLAFQSCSWCSTEVLHLFWAELQLAHSSIGYHPGRPLSRRVGRLTCVGWEQVCYFSLTYVRLTC